MTRLPSWSDFGTHDESAYHELWRGCVGAWAPCLGPTGLRLHDLSRYRNWGTLTNMDAATDWVVSGGQYALDFDGTNDVVRTSIPLPTYPFSLSIWASMRTLHDGALCYIAASGNNNPGIGLRCTAGGLIMLVAEDQVTGTSIITSTTGYVVGQWIHVCGVFGSATNRALYVNGIPNGTSSTSIVIDAALNRFSLGSFDRTSPALFFNGWLDDAFRYSRTLTASEARLLATRRGIAYERRKRRSVFFDAAFFNPAWARNSNVILSPVGAA